ncbi:pre-mRNA processing RNA-helicase, partial [Coemansia sp. RSA 1694]
MSQSHTFRRSNRGSGSRRDSRSPERGWGDSPAHSSSSRSRKSPSPHSVSRRHAEREYGTTRESTTPSTASAAPDAAASSADTVKGLSVRERLALWRKSKEQAKPAEQTLLAAAAAAEMESRPVSRASSAADDGNHFVTAPSSVASDIHTGSEAAFESLPATPPGPSAVGALSANAPRLQSGLNTVGRPLGAKPKLVGRVGINSRRPLLKPSLLSKSVFGSDDAGTDTGSLGGGGSLQRPKRPPIDFSAMPDSVSTAAIAADSPLSADTAMEVDVAESDPLEDYMQGVGALADDSSKDADMLDGSRGDVQPHAEPGQILGSEEVGFDDEAAEDPEDALALAAKRLKKKDLAIVDHSKMNYEGFKKDFYIEPAELRSLTPEEVDMMRVDLGGVKIRGADPPKPATSWSHFGLPAACADVIRHQGFEKPTPVQAQSVPAILSGRDVIGVAKTGSGKTLAFILPMLRHIKAQRPLAASEGPIGL